jgi:dTDP-4-amino-4,6-dideoxygalactose transaminase
MKVPFLNLAREAETLVALGLMADIEEVVRSGRFLFGPKAMELEIRLSEMFGRPVVLVGSGTDALAISLKALGVGPGDKVAVPSLSAIPTAVAVRMTGAEPVYIDVDGGCTMDAIHLEREVSRHLVKAAVPVHLYGNPADIGRIRTICSMNRVMLVEDCAQSFGAVGNGSLLGTIGMAGALSFYPTKNLGCMGDGGAIVACSERMAQAARELRFYGQKDRQSIGSAGIGMNSRMDEIQCAVLLRKLQLFPAQSGRRREMRTMYDAAVSQTAFGTPEWREGAVPHLYPIMSANRPRTMAAFAEKGIETDIHYPFHLMEAVERAPGSGEFSEAKRRADSVLSIPFNPWMTDEEIKHVLQAVREIGA